MPKDPAPIAVTSRSFSSHPILRRELLEHFENVKFNDEGKSLSGAELVAFLRGSERAITALEKVDGKILSELPELKLISKYGVGLDMIDQDAMKAFGVRLAWTGGVNRRSVSELVLCLTLSCLRKVPFANREVQNGRFKQIMGGQLTGKTFGIIGAGHVGRDLVGLLQPFGGPILVYDIRDVSDELSGTRARQVPLEELLKHSDIVSLHVPLDKSTQGLLNEHRLHALKKGAVLINTARGGIVDEACLKFLLKSGHLSAAAFDVFGEEPPQDSELLNLPNFLATPHIGGSSEEAVLAMGRSAIAGLCS